MMTRLGRSERDAGLATSAEIKVGDAPARRYASFVVRGWRPGTNGTLEVAHDQSGESVRASSLVEAIGWIQSRAATAPAPDDVSQAWLLPGEPIDIVRGGERRARKSVEHGNLEVVAAA